jgi:hypothetical protein
MTMARRGTARDADKERLWRRRLEQQRRSGLSVRAFCAAEGISEPSFYAWRRLSAERGWPAADGVDQSQTQPADSANAHNAPQFLPLHVVPTAASRPLELVLGSGHIVRVPSGFDAVSLRQLLALLEEQPPC